MKRIGMLTSGGDCQALNAAMRGVVKGLNANLDELEIYGFYDGYKGLIYGELSSVDIQRFFRNSDKRRNNTRNIPSAV